MGGTISPFLFSNMLYYNCGPFLSIQKSLACASLTINPLDLIDIFLPSICPLMDGWKEGWFLFMLFLFLSILLWFWLLHDVDLRNRYYKYQCHFLKKLADHAIIHSDSQILQHSITSGFPIQIPPLNTFHASLRNC